MARRLVALLSTACLVVAAISAGASAQVTGSGTPNRLAKFTAASSIGDSIVIEKDGRLGIGTPNPKEVLDVIGGAFFRGNSSRAMFGAKQTGSGDVAGFFTGSTPRLIIANNGNVGIGTPTPGFPLDVLGNVSVPLTGFVSVAPGSINVTGISTRFTSEADVGGAIRIGSEVHTVATMQSDFSLSLAQPHSEGATGVTAYVDPKWLLNFANGDSVPQMRMSRSGELRIGASQRGYIYYNEGGQFFTIECYGGMLLGTAANDPVRIMQNAEERIYIARDGFVGIGTSTPATRLDVNGALTIRGGADLAEPFKVSGGHSIRPGMLVAIDPSRPGELRLACGAYDTTVAGVISGANGINSGLILRQENSEADGSHPVAMAGRVYCWADAGNGPIVPGDLLTTSDTPGHAMKVTDHGRAHGAIIGKAMTGLPAGRGLVLVLVTLQ